MKKLAIVIILALLFAGCATTSNFCKDQFQANAAKAYIYSALQIVQVGYPFVANIAGIEATSPLVLGAVGAIDASLDGLGKLAYDVLCPGMAEMQRADILMVKAQEAKVLLGVK
jgi:outer membrane lipoprotein SlyB